MFPLNLSLATRTSTLVLRAPAAWVGQRGCLPMLESVGHLRFGTPPHYSRPDRVAWCSPPTALDGRANRH
jgi:hypothetical protein